MFVVTFFFVQAEDGIRDLVRSRGLGDVYKRQHLFNGYLEDLVYTPKFLKSHQVIASGALGKILWAKSREAHPGPVSYTHLTLPTSDLV